MGDRLFEREQILVGEACSRIGKHTPQTYPGEPLSNHRRVCLLTMGANVKTEPTQAAVLQRAGEITGELTEIETLDQSKRPSTAFYGSPEACWAPFKGPVHHLVRLNLNETERRRAAGEPRKHIYIK